VVKKVSKKGRVYYYDPEAAKRRREAIMEAARRGGYVPQRRRVGLGIAERRVSRTGRVYYYIPWAKLTPEQKEARLEYGRRIRKLARLAREAGLG